MPLKEDQIDLSGLYPGLDPDQLEQARVNLERYLGVIFRISERQARDIPPEAAAVKVR